MMFEELMELLDRQIEVSPFLLRGVLLVGLLFVSVHLLTMLVTRWGDKMTTIKSFVFSVATHLVLIVLVWVPEELIATQSEKEKPVQIRKITFEGETKTKFDDSGNTPVWEKPPETVDLELVRLERLLPELQPLESSKRPPEELTPPELDLPDLPSLPDRPIITPQPQQRGESGPKVEAATLTKIDDPTAEARQELIIPSPVRERLRVVRTRDSETPISRTPAQSNIDRVDSRLVPPRELALLEAVPDPRSALKRGPVDEKNLRRVGMAPSVISIDDPGLSAEETSSGEERTLPTSPRISRLRTRTPQSRPEGNVERFRPERTPRTSRPESDGPAGVRQSTPVDISRIGVTPNIARPNLDAARTVRRSPLSATYRLRSLARRKDIARKYGGTEQSERAVEASLQWLAANQTSKGYWNADAFQAGQVEIDENKVNRRFAGKNADTGLTALAVLAFLSVGYTHEEGQYTEHVERALVWLIQQQREDGYLGGTATHYAKHYCHAMATYALAEAYAMQSDPSTDTRLREPIHRAVAYILDTQNPSDGGWRYLKGQFSDMSMFGWQLMALKSAEASSLQVPSAAKEKMILFLKNRSRGQNKGLAGYRADEPPSPAMTAEALFCKQMLGIDRDNPASTEAVGYLLEHLPRRSQLNLYYWYYGTLAMYQYGGKAWRDWNESVRDVLVAEQVKRGPNAGSWDPKGPWGPYGGRIYSTALSTLCLEVYSRYLPLYQMGGQYDK